MTQPAEAIPPPEEGEAPPPPQTVTMQDRAGQTHEVPLAQAKDAFNSGKFGFVGPLRGKDENGEIGTVRPDRIEHFLAHPDTEIASEQEWHEDQLQKKYGGIGGIAATAAAGALSGASLGASDVLAGAVSPEAKQWLREHYEANPGTALASKIGGAFLPGLASGGATSEISGAELAAEGAEAAQAAAAAGTAEASGAGGLLATVGRGAAKTIGAPMNATAAAGHAVEHAVAGLLGEGAEGSIITRLAKGALSKGAGLGVEGAIYGVADQINEDVLGDHELNAEKILASGVHGALIGGATGGALSSLGTLGQYVIGRAAPSIGGMAEEQAARALQPKAASIREFDRVPGGAQGIGRRLLDEGLVRPGDTIEQIAPRITAAKEAAGDRIGQFLRQADEVAAPGASMRDIETRIHKDVLAPLEKAPELNSTAISEIKKVLRTAERFSETPSIEEAGQRAIDRDVLAEKPMTFAKMQDLKRTIGDSINWKSAGPYAVPDKANDAAKKAYGILSDLIEEKGEQAADRMGVSKLDDYKEAKLAYQQLKAADKAATNSLDLKAARNFAAPSDKAAGIGVLAGMLGHGAGGPLSLAAGIASGAASRLIRERTASTSAVLLDKLASLRAVERAGETIDRQVDRGVAGMVGETHRAPVVPRKAAGFVGPHVDKALESVAEHTPSAARDVVSAGVQARQEHTSREQYAARVAAVQKVAGNIEQHAQNAQAAASPIAAHAPKTAKAMEAGATRAVTYLASQLPKRQPPPSITPQFDRKFVAPEQEQKEFIRKYDAVHDPASVLKDAAEGKATKAQVDAIRAVYPKLYAEIVQKAQEKLSDLKHPMTSNQRLNMGLLLGIPADATMAPQFVASMQQTFAPEQPKPPPGPPKGQHRNTLASHPLDSAKQSSLHIGNLES